MGVLLLMSVTVYPPSAAHAHHASHGPAAAVDAQAAHHAHHGDHAHHDSGDAHGRGLKAADSGTSSDTPNCCQGICMAAVIAQSPTVLPDGYRAEHKATWLPHFSLGEPTRHLRPPKHLI